MDVDGDDAEENFETAIVLAEDKKYYPTAEEVYGPGTETLIMDEDAQPLEEPIIAPVKKKQIEADRGKNALELKVSEEYLRGLMGNANLVRNVAVAGHLHHGKTTLFGCWWSRRTTWTTRSCTRTIGAGIHGHRVGRAGPGG